MRRLRSQYWDSDRLHRHVQTKLARTLAAATRIPFYTTHYSRAASVESFSQLPILKRSDVHELFASVRSMYPGATDLMHDSSSGSTGMPAEFLFDNSHQRGRFASRARYLRAYGWHPLRRTVWLVGDRFILDVGDEPDTQLVRSKLMRGITFIRVSSNLEEQFEQIVKVDPVYLYSFPSVLDGLLAMLQRTDRQLRSLKCIFTGAEVVDDSLRERARRVLGVEIADNYGSTEAFLAWQCPAGSYHINAEHVLVEILGTDGGPVAPGEIGRVIVTTLENRLMPLIRYEIGDWAYATNAQCRCGRTLPLIERLAGREMSLFRLADGRLASPYELIGLMKKRPEILQFQIVQKSLDSYLVRHVSRDPLDPDAESWIRVKFNEILRSSVKVSFERVASIDRLPNGKFIPAISEVTGC